MNTILKINLTICIDPNALPWCITRNLNKNNNNKFNNLENKKKLRTDKVPSLLENNCEICL